MALHEFYPKLAKILNSNKSRSVILEGNVYDFFFDGKDFVTLIPFLCKKSDVNANGATRGITKVIYEVNHPLRFEGDVVELKQAWAKFFTGKDNTDFDDLVQKSQENFALAVEFMKELTTVSQESKLKNNLLVIIEAADMLLPIGNLATLPFADRKRIAIFHDWFSNPKFATGHDSVILLTESRSLLHPLVARLPQVISIQVPSPNSEERAAFSNWMVKKEVHVEMTASLNLQAYRQLLCDGPEIDVTTVIEKVQDFIVDQLGDDVVEFKRPNKTLKDVVGFAQLKQFIAEEMIPRFQAGPDSALPGAAVAGPIGGGKTFLMEAMAAELGMPVLVLKNLRSQWYGQTDVIFERLKRVLEALGKVCIFCDEADTQFGGIGPEAHETERRLTGKIQEMMSDTSLLGRVIWLLMTARIHLLSADIRRPGRVGDLILPVLDPEGDDRLAFIRWTVGKLGENLADGDMKALDDITKGYSAASFASLRSQIKSKKCTTIKDAIAIANDLIPPDIGDTRRYQVLQGLLNCTRMSLLPKELLTNVKSRGDLEALRSEWRQDIQKLESKGIR